MKLTELLKEYARERPNVERDSIRIIGFTINNFRSFLGREPVLEDLSKANLLDHLRWNLLKRAARTCNHHRGNLLTLWNFAAEQNWLPDPPKIVKLKEPERDPICWTLEEIGLLYKMTDCLKGCYGDVPKSLAWKIALSVAWDTAIRIGSLRKANLADVDLNTGIWICQAETIKGKRRDEYKQLHPQTLELLKQSTSLESLPRKRLWPFPFSGCTATRQLGRLLDLAGLPNDRKHKFHCIRKTSESYAAAERGIEWAAAAVGHTPEVARKVYVSKKICRPPALIDALPRPFSSPLPVG